MKIDPEKEGNNPFSGDIKTNVIIKLLRIFILAILVENKKDVTRHVYM